VSIISVLIKKVSDGSPAEWYGIKPGDSLISINGHEINDILDLHFFETDKNLTIEYINRSNKKKVLHVKKSIYETLGLEFSSFLIDDEKACRNKCVFCFIDQMPPGMRETLYFKDDDSRLSFLFGNYITLTNLEEKDIERIVQMHISPVNISVHTMNPELRCKMMKNKFAGDSLKYLYELTEKGIDINCQIVLCPGVNDGKELSFTISKLIKMGDSVKSIACVPVGLTRYRKNLPKLTNYNKQSAGKVIDLIDSFGNSILSQKGKRLVYPSDEFYIIAERDLPLCDYYDGYPQIENGVGMIRSFIDDFKEEAVYLNGISLSKKITIGLITGTLFYPYLKMILDEINLRCDNLYVKLFPVKNLFFGGNVSVTGLLTGRDIIFSLSDNLELKSLEALIIPSAVLKSGEDIFLDDYKLSDLSNKLKIKVIKTDSTGDGLVKEIISICKGTES
jgi:putative radical SAM enzyme (TIGR03279 family)